MRAAIAAFWLVMSIGLPAFAQDVVYLIRHAEKAQTGADPALTPDGRTRAAAWAEMLEFAGLDVVITSEARRTRETGEIIADGLTLPQVSLPPNDIAGLVDLLQFDHEDDAVLIVGHAETIPRIVDAIGGSGDFSVDQSEFDNLFILFDAKSGSPAIVRLRMP